MAHLNVYQCQLPDDNLQVWRYPSNDKRIPKRIDEEFDSIVTDDQASPAIAVPTNDEGRRVLEDETGYEQRDVSWEDYLWIYSNLVQYGIVRHLKEDHNFEPLQVDQEEAKNNRVYELYKPDPLSEPADGLEIRPGLKIRSRYWDLPGHGPFVGINFSYTSTNYFNQPLDELLDGVDNKEFWLKMNCPSDCTHTECEFHGHSGLIGEFNGFSGTGEECRYETSSSDQYASLANSVNGIEANPPVERATIEASYANIHGWATDKYGSSKSGIIGDISSQRLGIPDHVSYKDANEREAKFELERLEELVDEIDRELQLPTGQEITIADQPVQIST